MLFLFKKKVQVKFYAFVLNIQLNVRACYKQASLQVKNVKSVAYVFFLFRIVSFPKALLDIL